MDDQTILIRALQQYHPEANIKRISDAYVYASENHKGQKRISGEPYFNHVFATAQKLADWQLPENIIIAGLLHDVPEDTSLNPEEVKKKLEEIEKKFGKDIASMVNGVTKLGKVQYHGMERYVENLRKMFISIAKDARVIFIKFADRINNLQDLDVIPKEKAQRIAKEALDIYAAVANRLGMGVMKGELEDTAFQYVNKSEYERIKNIMQERVPHKEEYLEEIRHTIEDDIKNAGLKAASIHGRVKHIYSLYKKLLKKDNDINKIYDLVAERIIVPTVQDCYTILGILHQRWKPLKGRVKDYIAQPKPNGYQSLHTTVFTGDGEIVEFQIRTKEMHEDAEYGIAAHWRYDESSKESAKNPKRVQWLNELARIQKELHDRKSFLETLEELKIDIFQNRIFIFTPKGDVLDLPEESTPVDAAYAIHSEIGNHCCGARVNGEIASLDTKLNSEDIVEIITDPKRKGPAYDWIKFVKTRGAREKIKSYSRKGISHWIQNIIPNQK